MACRLSGTEPLSKPMMTYCQLDPKGHISMKYHLKFKSFHSRKCIWKCHLWNGSHFVSASMCYKQSRMIIVFIKASILPRVPGVKDHFETDNTKFRILTFLAHSPSIHTVFKHQTKVSQHPQILAIILIVRKQVNGKNSIPLFFIFIFASQRLIAWVNHVRTGFQHHRTQLFIYIFTYFFPQKIRNKGITECTIWLISSHLAL